jgi:hypothetical protein
MKEVGTMAPIGSRFFFLATCIISALIGFMPALVQTKDRLVEWPPYPFGRINSAADGIKLSPATEALEIVDVQVAGHSITIAQAFPADDDWLRSLTFRMKNISAQSIVGARIQFGLPETKVEDNSLGFTLEYGKGLSTGILSDEQKVIMPNEEFE